MYVPPSFRVTDTAVLQDFIDQHGFATLISQANGEPFATHLPLMLDRGAGDLGRLAGHVAKANSQWRSLADQPLLAIFHGPHAYISPGWMEARDVVPTWNYVAVHAYGRAQLVDNAIRLREIVEQLVAKYEASRPTPWSLAEPSAEYLDRMLAGIVGFEVEVERLEGKWKLSQNYPPERRQSIMDGLRETDRPDELAIADLMHQTLPPPA